MPQFTLVFFPLFSDSTLDCGNSLDQNSPFLPDTIMNLSTVRTNLSIFDGRDEMFNWNCEQLCKDWTKHGSWLQTHQVDIAVLHIACHWYCAILAEYGGADCWQGVDTASAQISKYLWGVLCVCDVLLWVVWRVQILVKSANIVIVVGVSITV